MKTEVADSPSPAERGRDPVVEAYKAGVDRTLLWENLKRSPTERLENLQALQAFAEDVRRAGRKHRAAAG